MLYTPPRLPKTVDPNGHATHAMYGAAITAAPLVAVKLHLLPMQPHLAIIAGCTAAICLAAIKEFMDSTGKGVASGWGFAYTLAGALAAFVALRALA